MELLKAPTPSTLEVLAPHDPPSTLLGVAALGYDGQLVEVEAVAALVG